MAAANARFFARGATTTGLQEMSWFLLVVAGLLALVTVLYLPNGERPTSARHHS